MAKSNLSGGLKEAMGNYERGAEGENVTPEENKDGSQHDGDMGQMMSVMHMNHHEAGKHSKHMLSKDGKMQSEEHAAGEGGADCPMCGK